MKLKRLPDDFRVEELTDFAADGGPFALYVLEKRSLGTLEAVAAIVRKWNLARERVAYGGLKDKHAVSRQYITIHNGPPHNLRQTNFEILYQGQASREFRADHITGNRFELVLRDLTPPQLAHAQRGLEAAARDGLPNYFDSQRFGSLGESGEFLALPWCRGDYERAVWLALADPNPRDRPDQREEKRLLREHWGDWSACRGALANSPLGSVVNFLAHNPRNFRSAITYIRQDLRSLYLAAFQSYLWNQMLAEFLREQLGQDQSGNSEKEEDSIAFYSVLTDDQRAVLASAVLPLPSARLHLADGPTKELIERVLGRHGLEQREMRIKYPRDSFFSKGDRAVIFFPRNLRHEPAEDDLYPGQQKLCLAFDLPRGSYATILVKRITSVV